MNIKITIIAFGILILSGCVPTTVTVLEHRPVSKPFSRVLCFYLDEGCDFSLFDSTLYKICLRNQAVRDSGFDERGNKESVVAEKLSSPGTAVWAATYWLDPARNSYAEFLHFIDSMKVDGLLIVGVRGYWHEEHWALESGGAPGIPGGMKKVTNINGHFMCDLFDTKSLIRPVFRAEISEKGGSDKTKIRLTAKLVQQVVESLKGSQYVAR